MITDTRNVHTADLITTASYQNMAVYKKLDNLLLIVLIFSGWSIEWNARSGTDWPPAIVFYLRLAAPIALLAYCLIIKKSNRLITTYTGLLKPFVWFVFFFAGIVLAEKIENGFQDVWLHWKDYYQFALLPFWGWLGFDIGGNRQRTLRFMRNAAICGSAASYISFSMIILGVLEDSPVGPMYWPYRFIAIFGFFYFLTMFVINLNRDRVTIFWLFGCSLSVFWGLYKFTIVSTVIGLLFWLLLIALKGRHMKWKGILAFLLLINIALFGIFVINELSHGNIFKSAQEMFVNRWTKQIDEFDDTGTFERLNRISGGRFQMWEEVLQRIEEHPILGSGLGQTYESNIVIHNGYLDLTVSFGLLGILVFLAVLFVWLRTLFRSRPESNSLLIFLTCSGFMATILAANLFGSVWVLYPTINAYMMLMGGISLRISANSNKSLAVRYV